MLFTQWIDRKRLIIACLVLLAAIVYVGKTWTPSSYGLVLQSLGIANEGPAFGTAQAYRSDEYSVQTPYFQIAVRSHLDTYDHNSPYHETLKSFMAFPTRDWTAIFKPQLWGFLVLKPAHAYSLYFFFLATAFLFGWYMFFGLLNIPSFYAAAGSAMLFFSHFIQAWWTSNATVFAFAPWVGAAFLWSKNETTRFLLVFYTFTVWLFGLLYPPFLYGMALVMAVCIISFRQDTVRVRSIIVAILATACAGGVVFFYMHDVIEIMRNTVYPGKRSMSGGTTPPVQLLQSLFPYFSTVQFDPTLLQPETINVCEVGAVSSFLPLMTFCFGEWRSIISACVENKRATLLFFVTIVLAVVWMIFPIPSSAGRFVLLDMVPPRRLLLVFGFLINIFLIYLAPRMKWSLSPIGATIFLMAVLAAAHLSKGHLPWSVQQTCWFDVAIIPLVGIALLCGYVFRHKQIFGIALLTMAAVCNAITFGTFNPLQPARPIFRHTDSAVIDDLHAMAKISPHGWLAINGWYGAELNGLGVSAINHTLMSPQISFLSSEFPELSAEQKNYDFNRYAHIIPSFVPEPEVVGDTLHIPVQRFADRAALKPLSFAQSGGWSGSADSYALLRTSDGHVLIQITGWGLFSSVNQKQAILYAGNDLSPIGITRDLRPDVAQSKSDPHMNLAGFRAFFRTSTADENLNIRLLSSDPQRGIRTIPNLTTLLVSNKKPDISSAHMANKKGYLDAVSVDSSTGIIRITGWMPYRLAEGQSLEVFLPDTFTSAELHRIYRQDLKTIGPGWEMSGFEIDLMPTSLQQIDSNNICLIAMDPTEGNTQLIRADGSGTCEKH